MASDRAKRQLAAWKRQGRTETVIYRPESGRPRRIDAVVFRTGRVEENGGWVQTMRVKVLLDEQLGIAARQLDSGADQLDVADRVGGEAVTRRVGRIAGQDVDWITIEVG